MRRKRYFIYSLFLMFLIPAFFMFLMNSGCGSAGGGAVYFETVEITAHYKSLNPLFSDIAIWEAESEDDICCNACTVWSDLIDVVIQSQSFQNIKMLPSDIRIEKVRIDYIPKNNSPPLASRELSLGQFVKPDSDYTLQIEVITGNQKKTYPLYQVRKGEIHCSSDPYTYDVKFTFTGIETATDKQRNFSTIC